MSSNSRLSLIAAAGLASLLAACVSPTDVALEKKPPPRTPTEQYSVKTVDAPQELLFAPRMDGLSPAQQEALAHHSRIWAEEGVGGILIEAPTDGGEAAGNTAQAAAEAMTSLGVPAEAIRIVGYNADPRAPVRISFNRPEALVEDCNRSWDRLTATHANRPYANFGCTTKANLAAMIANPADIDAPRAMQPGDAARRQVVLDKYRAGQVTSSERDDQAQGAVSNVSR